MAFTYGQRSMMRLDGVHPDLKRVFMHAIEASPIDWMIVEGVRSREGCMVNWGKGRTASQLAAWNISAQYAKPGLPKVTWLRDPFNSKHCKQADGFSHAVDALPAPYDWKIEDPKATPEMDDNFAKMAVVILQSASILQIPVRWGANWDGDTQFREKGETDNPHFELVG